MSSKTNIDALAGAPGASGKVGAPALERWLSRLTAALGWIAPLLLALPMLRTAMLFAGESSPARTVDLLYDDAYYYLTIACNVVETGRSTFDGLTLTNGYQPLWQLLLVGWTAVVGTAPFRLFFATGLLVYAVIAGTALVLGALSLARRLSPEARWPAIGLPLGVLCGNEYVFVGGMETVLFLPLFVPLALAVERRSGWTLGACLAIAAMIRLDALALLVAYLAVSFAVERQVVRRLLLVVAPAVIVFATYFAWNAAVFGSPVPVSGLSKALDGPRFHNFGIALYYWLGVSRLLPLLVGLGALEWLARRDGGSPGNWGCRTLAMFAGAGVVQYLYYAGFSTWPIWPWYTYTVSFAGAAACARAVHLFGYLASRGKSLPALVAASALTAYAGWFSFALSGNPLHPPVNLGAAPAGVLANDPRPLSFGQVSLLTLESFFREHAPVHVAMGDRAGGLSFFGRGRVSVIQTEGLVLGDEYFRARKEGRGEAYLTQLPIDYLVVDREFVPWTMGPSGKTYIVTEPVQGRATIKPGPTFCFPESAVAQWLKYAGWSQRIAFTFGGRMPCPAAALSAISRLARDPGIRRLSLPVEYGSIPGLRLFEDLDRRGISAESP